MMRKLFPAPLLSLGLVAMWLLLNESLSAGHVVLALLFGWLLPVLFAPLHPSARKLATFGDRASAALAWMC